QRRSRVVDGENDQLAYGGRVGAVQDDTSGIHARSKTCWVCRQRQICRRCPAAGSDCKPRSATTKSRGKRYRGDRTACDRESLLSGSAVNQTVNKDCYWINSERILRLQGADATGEHQGE